MLLLKQLLQLKERLTSSEYANEIRQKIDDDTTHDVMYYEPTFDFVQHKGTTHLNVLGPDGSAVAMTSSIDLYFGSAVRGSRTGIIFNAIMSDFSIPGTVNFLGIPASPSNYIQPGKMPMSSMAPTLVFDSNGKVVLVSGASGGTMITTATASVIFNSLWFDLDLRTATDMPRVHHQLVPNCFSYEPNLDSVVHKGLLAKNHLSEITTIKNHSSEDVTLTSTVGTIRNRYLAIGEGLCIEAVSDGRKGGVPDGY